MKTAVLIFRFLVWLNLILLVSNPKHVDGQQIQLNSDRNWASARGNYKVLQSLSPDANSSRLALDKLNFPYDPKWADKVLSVKPYYLRSISDADFKLPVPPANSSDQVRGELDYLLFLQHNRSIQDITNSIYISNNPLTPSDIGQMIGYWVGPQKLPLTDSLMSKLTQDGNYFLWLFKFKYARVRPYMLDPKIHDMEESLASSYPSGHVTYAYIYAFIYQELAPEFSDFFIAKAYEMSQARQIIGVHYPSDCEGSRVFARQFVDLLFQNENFRADFEQVKKEWARKKKESWDIRVEAVKEEH